MGNTGEGSQYKKLPEKLNHYTTLPVLLGMLIEKRFFFGNPDKWEDENDRELMSLYKNRKKLKSLFALCFSCSSETIHHWNTFGSSISGCCIEFDLEKLVESVEKSEGIIRCDRVNYMTIDNVRNTNNTIDLPFTKRKPYECEEEYRIIWEDSNAKKTSCEIKFDLHSIRKITISQKMPKKLFELIKDHLKALCLDNCSLKINHSTLSRNKEWINAVRLKK